MIFIGIDPGLDGFICWFDDADHKILFQKTPTMPAKKKGRDYDGEALAGVIRELKTWFPAQEFFAAIERVSIFPIKRKPGEGGKENFGNSMGSNAKQFYCSGLFHGTFFALGIPFVEAHSQTWKADILKGTTKDKSAAIAYVQKRFPSLGISRMLVKDRHNLADAICIGLYGEKIHGGNK